MWFFPTSSTDIGGDSRQTAIQPGSLSLAANDFRRRDGLAGMSLRVVCRMGEESQHCAGPLCPANQPLLQQRGRRRYAQQGEGSGNARVDQVQQRLYRNQGGGMGLLGGQRGALFVGERLAFGIRDQPFETAGQVTEMKTG